MSATAATSFLHPFTCPTAGDFLTIVRGQGALVYDADDREYVDGMASLWYCNIGHGRGEVAEAIARQVRTLGAYHTFERFTNAPTEELCDRLAELAPMPEARVFLTSSGSEAVDSAIKLARFVHALNGETERTVIVSRTPSYHGVTYGGVSATGLPKNQERFGPLLPDVRQVPYDDLAAVAAIMENDPDRVAAVIAEPVVGAGGVLPPPEGYLAGLRDLCDRHGALLILDEVICGFGRLGAWWGASRYDVMPDLVTFAKGVTSGYLPLGGVLVGRRARAALERDPDTILRHGHTYSGHPTCAVAALESLRITEEEALLDRAVDVGERLSKGLTDLLGDGLVCEVRGDGAVWAVGLDGVDAGLVREAMLEGGVIARPIGGDTIAFSPPLVISAEQVDRCVEVLGGAVERVRAGWTP